MSDNTWLMVITIIILVSATEMHNFVEHFISTQARPLPCALADDLGIYICYFGCVRNSVSLFILMFWGFLLTRT